VAKLNNEINAALADPALNTRLGTMGYTVFAGPSADFSQVYCE
jgi:hypothetical protein